MVDPTKVKHIPTHSLTDEHIRERGKPKDPHNKKTHQEIPRLSDDHILEDDDGIHEEELKKYFTNSHLD